MTYRRLDQKVAIVTGGARGIGYAIVDKLCAEGAHVCFLDRDSERGTAAAGEFEKKYPQRPPEFSFCDITVAQQIEAIIGSLVACHGKIDVLVNNAGVGAYFDAAEMTEAQWDTVFAVDLKGLWLTTRYVLPTMRSSRAGSIVNIASIHAHMTHRGMFPYAAAKSGVLGLTRSLALDEGPNGIRVNTINPGYIRTDLLQEYLSKQQNPAEAERSILSVHPLQRIGAPVDVANLVSFLASDEAAFITGADFAVDGGLSARFAT